MATRFVFNPASLAAAKRKLSSASRPSPASQGKPAAKSASRDGGVITVDLLRSIKLRKTTTPARESGSKRRRPPPAGGMLAMMQDITNVKLRKTTLPRSPGGTPAKPKKRRSSRLPAGFNLTSAAAARNPAFAAEDVENLSPSKARDNGEFLRRALHRKFRSANALPLSSDNSFAAPSPAPVEWSFA